MDEIKETVQQIIPKITPSPKDKRTIKKALDLFLAQVQNHLDSQKIDACIEVVGSIAKDTYLKNCLDIDVFVLFDPNVKRSDMVQIIRRIGQNILKDAEECYAEHPYIRGTFKDFKIELVPGYQITDASEKISAVDRTPLHTKYIQKHISKTQKQEIRLFKQFLHGIGCYGAEAEIQGFSGYLCEILILYYHSFQKLLDHAQQWRPPIQLSLHNEPTDRFSDPLVFIDPIDKERNVASAVSNKTLHRFINASQAFLKHPTTTFFFPNPVKPWPPSKIKPYLTRSKTQYIGIVFSKPDLISENLIPQIRRTCKTIQKKAKRNDFIIHDMDFTIDHTHQLVYLIIKADSTPLAPTYEHMGPPITLTDHVQKFKKKWKQDPLLENGPFEKNKRLYVTVKRTHQTLLPYLLTILPTTSFGRHIGQQIQDKFLLIKDEELLKKELQVFWTRYFDKKQPWER